MDIFVECRRVNPNTELIISLATFQADPIQVKVSVSLVSNYLTGIGSKPVEANVTGSEPYVWTYVPEASLDKRSHVTVKVKSGDKDVCGLVALQPRECPFQDLVMDAKYHSRYFRI